MLAAPDFCADADVQDIASVKDTAAQAVIEFIRSPDLFQFDLFESRTITQLKGDSQYGHLYQLLEIVLNGSLQASLSLAADSRCISVFHIHPSRRIVTTSSSIVTTLCS